MKASPIGRLEIQGDGLLSPVATGEIARNVCFIRLRGELPASRDVALHAYVLDFDDGRAQFRQKLSGARAGQDAGEFENDKVGEHWRGLVLDESGKASTQVVQVSRSV